jgi:hypothetical protein
MKNSSRDKRAITMESLKETLLYPIINSYFLLKQNNIMDLRLSALVGGSGF